MAVDPQGGDHSRHGAVGNPRAHHELAAGARMTRVRGGARSPSAGRSAAELKERSGKAGTSGQTVEPGTLQRPQRRRMAALATNGLRSDSATDMKKAFQQALGGVPMVSMPRARVAIRPGRFDPSSVSIPDKVLRFDTPTRAPGREPPKANLKTVDMRVWSRSQVWPQPCICLSCALDLGGVAAKLYS